MRACAKPGRLPVSAPLRSDGRKRPRRTLGAKRLARFRRRPSTLGSDVECTGTSSPSTTVRHRRTQTARGASRPASANAYPRSVSSIEVSAFVASSKKRSDKSACSRPPPVIDRCLATIIDQPESEFVRAPIRSPGRKSSSLKIADRWRTVRHDWLTRHSQ